MNKVVIVGRLTRDPDVRRSNTTDQTAIARFTLAVDRKYKRNGEPDADFISCVAFGKTAEFCEKYFSKGAKIGACGRIQTGSYKDKDNKTVYTTDVVLEEVEFGESKSEANNKPADNAAKDGFRSVEQNVDEDLPFI